MIIPMLRSLIQRRQKMKEKNEDKEEKLTLTGPKRVIASFFGVAGGLLAGVFGISGTCLLYTSECTTIQWLVISLILQQSYFL